MSHALTWACVVYMLPILVFGGGIYATIARIGIENAASLFDEPFRERFGKHVRREKLVSVLFIGLVAWPVLLVLVACAKLHNMTEQAMFEYAFDDAYYPPTPLSFDPVTREEIDRLQREQIDKLFQGESDAPQIRQAGDADAGQVPSPAEVRLEQADDRQADDDRQPNSAEDRRS